MMLFFFLYVFELSFLLEVGETLLDAGGHKAFDEAECFLNVFRIDTPRSPRMDAPHEAGRLEMMSRSHVLLTRHARGVCAHIRGSGGYRLSDPVTFASVKRPLSPPPAPSAL